MSSITDEIVLELARLQRAAMDRLQRRAAEQQLGEAWVDLIPAHVDERQSEEAA